MVDWGDYVHLVPLTKLQAFCDAYNRGQEPEGNEGLFLKSSTGGTRHPDLPALPPPWNTLLRATRGEGAVTELLADGHAMISLGRTDGLKIGQNLMTSGNAKCKIVVAGLQDRAAKVRRYDATDPELEAGAKVLAPWRLERP